jgi:hypothetical protein
MLCHNYMSAISAEAEICRKTNGFTADSSFRWNDSLKTVKERHCDTDCSQK